jgi:hypothetical protein
MAAQASLSIVTGNQSLPDLSEEILHTYIIGNTGTGKTTLERFLITQRIAEGDGVCVIDPHGEREGCLVDSILSDLPDSRVNDVIYFDINNPQLIPGLKPFYCRDRNNEVAVQDTISTALNMFEKVYNVDRTTMARIIAYIEALIYLFIYDDSLTLLDVPNLLNPDIKYDKKRLQACTHLPPSPGFNFTRDFWTEEYSRRAKRGYNQDSEIFGTLMKFRELSSHLLWPMFCQKTNTLDFRQIMAEKKILLVKLNGNWEDITSLIGSYLIGQIKDAAMSRSLNDPPFYLFIDEFSTMASRDFLKLFSEGRGGNIHITLNHQVVSQLDNDMKETIRQASCFVCFQVTDITAASVATMFDTTPPPGQWIYEKQMRQVNRVDTVIAWDSPALEQEYNRLSEKITRLTEQKSWLANQHIPKYFPYVHGAMLSHVYKEHERLSEQRNLVASLGCHNKQEIIYGSWYEPVPVVEEEYRFRGDLLNNNVKYSCRLGASPYGSDEVARRLTNQLKQLTRFTARMRLPSGEYVVQTQPPDPLIDITSRVKDIYTNNLAQGYVRKRSDVEAEFQTTGSAKPAANGHSTLQVAPLPTAVK